MDSGNMKRRLVDGYDAETLSCFLTVKGLAHLMMRILVPCSSVILIGFG